MTELKYTDFNKSIEVVFVTDLPKSCAGVGNFTVLEVKGRDDAEMTLGLTFQQIAFHTSAFTEFAETHDLKLEMTYQSSGETTVLRDFTGIYYMGGLGIDNI